MKKLTKTKIEELRGKVAVLRGIQKTLADKTFTLAVPAGVLRRYNVYLKKSKKLLVIENLLISLFLSCRAIPTNNM